MLLDIFLSIPGIVFLITCIVCVFIFIRNSWVFSRKIKLINNPQRSEYLSYDMMMLKFWIWDIEKLKKNK